MSPFAPQKQRYEPQLWMSHGYEAKIVASAKMADFVCHRALSSDYRKKNFEMIGENCHVFVLFAHGKALTLPRRSAGIP